MKLPELPLLFMLTFLGAAPLSAQPTSPPAAPAPAGDTSRLSVSQPATYSGISGPGEPVKGDGLGGWRSGNGGVQYKGSHPKPGWQLNWDEKQWSTDKVIELGLLPPIKPIWELHLRDTIICLGGDGNYYMTGSSGDNIWDKNDGIELWRSTDLKKWDYLGLVWSFAKDATWEKGADYVWAPEIHYLKSKKTYCLTLCVSTHAGSRGPSGTGILISTTGKPEGPYINPFKPDARATGGIDATVFEDDDGKIYFTWGHGSTIYQLKDDLSGFTDQGHHIQLDSASQQAAKAIGITDGVSSEGPSIFKREGKYYLGGAVFIGGVNRQTGKNGRYSSCVAISDNIYGPYTLYEEAVPCGAGGNYFQDKDGNWYCTYFGNDEASPFREKPGMVRIDFQPNGQIKIADNQPAFILRDGTPTQWRDALKKPAPAQVPTSTPATVAPSNGTLDASDTWNPAPMYTTHPEVYSGLSGPGHPVVGNGYGGYRTGREGTMYKGLDSAKPGWLDFGNRANGAAVKNGLLPPLRPIWELHLRDTTVCLGGDGNYYMTGSSGDNIWDRVDGVELWRSKDLQHWDYLGMIWSMAKDATWQKKYRYIWAPEIVYLKKLNTYCLALGWGPNGPTGILKSTSGKPEGPYVNPMANDASTSTGIDAALFEDDDSTVYFTSGSGGSIRKMKPDLSGFDGDAIQVKYSDDSHTGGPGHEGASLFKANGKYYIGAAATVDGRYSSVDAVADKIEGPYRNWAEAVPCGAGGNFFQDKDGNWWCTYFGNDDQSPWREKPGLVKIEFDEKGLIHIARKQPDFVLVESAREGKSPWSDGGKAASGPPLLGWSSWSNTWNANQKFNEDYIKAQADVMAAKLKSSGFVYINLDSGWARGFDEHGRQQPDLRKFPDGIAGLAAYVHAKGLKLGVYLEPGLFVAAWQANGTVAGTDIHLQDIADITKAGNTDGKGGKAYHINYTKPGAREYIQSYADMLASWGVDYIKMDFVGPGGGNVKADNREDMKVWQEALKKTGRPIWIELSNYLSFDNADVWKATSNGWRIENDVESYARSGKVTLTTWGKVSVRFNDAPKWAPYAGPGGWNDLDSLEIGNGDNDGLTLDERHTVMTLWCISCSPLILGSDLTTLDDTDLAIITNPEVLAVNQAGHVATPLSQQTKQQVWQVKNSDGSYTVAFFNLGDADAKVSVQWSELGLNGPATVRDLWTHTDLGKQDSGYETTLATHACRLLQVRP